MTRRLIACACALLSLVVVSADGDAPAHPEGWSWEELARRAGLRADKAKVELMKAAVRRQRVSADLAWKDPQLRLARSWEDSRDRRYGFGPENGDGDSMTIGMRFYVSNPFVNRQLRRQGDAQVESLEANAKAEAYAVYCEVKTLCLEAEFLRRDTSFRREELELVSRIRDENIKRLENGVASSPLDALRAETTRERVILKLSEVEQSLRRTRDQIAFLAGVPEQELRIRYTPPEPPTTNASYRAVLVETAFLRRPDLAGALADYEAARAGVGVAKAAYMPWFDFIEGSYSHQTSSRRDFDYRDTYSAKDVLFHDTKRNREDEWQVRVALSVPIFTWIGDSVKNSRRVADFADARVQSLRQAIETEISSAFASYCASDVRFVRLSDNGGAFLKQMEGRLAEYSRAASVRPEDVDKAQLEFLDYRRLKAMSEYDWIRAILLLESVSGGPLPHLPVPTTSAVPAKQLSVPALDELLIVP